MAKTTVTAAVAVEGRGPLRARAGAPDSATETLCGKKGFRRWAIEEHTRGVWRVAADQPIIVANNVSAGSVLRALRERIGGER